MLAGHGGPHRQCGTTAAWLALGSGGSFKPLLSSFALLLILCLLHLSLTWLRRVMTRPRRMSCSPSMAHSSCKAASQRRPLPHALMARLTPWAPLAHPGCQGAPQIWAITKLLVGPHLTRQSPNSIVWNPSRERNVTSQTPVAPCQHELPIAGICQKLSCKDRGLPLALPVRRGATHRITMT